MGIVINDVSWQCFSNIHEAQKAINRLINIVTFLDRAYDIRIMDIYGNKIPISFEIVKGIPLSQFINKNLRKR